jgi:hypothetical protein
VVTAPVLENASDHNLQSDGDHESGTTESLFQELEENYIAHEQTFPSDYSTGDFRCRTFERA